MPKYVMIPNRSPSTAVAVFDNSASGCAETDSVTSAKDSGMSVDNDAGDASGGELNIYTAHAEVNSNPGSADVLEDDYPADSAPAPVNPAPGFRGLVAIQYLAGLGFSKPAAPSASAAPDYDATLAKVPAFAPADDKDELMLVCTGAVAPPARAASPSFDVSIFFSSSAAPELSVSPAAMDFASACSHAHRAVSPPMSFAFISRPEPPVAAAPTSSRAQRMTTAFAYWNTAKDKDPREFSAPASRH